MDLSLRDVLSAAFFLHRALIIVTWSSGKYEETFSTLKTRKMASEEAF